MAARKPKKSGASRKRRTSATATAKKPLPAVGRLIATLAVAALFIGFLYSLARVDTQEDKSPKAKQPTQHATSNASGGTDKHYSFYSLLKDFEVKVPSFGDSDKRETSEQPSRYLIQAGSFKTEPQAEQQRAELILLGLTPTVEKTINSRGERWFRVLLGPYDSRSDMAHARTTLISNHFDAMVMKRNL